MVWDIHEPDYDFVFVQTLKGIFFKIITKNQRTYLSGRKSNRYSKLSCGNSRGSKRNGIILKSKDWIKKSLFPISCASIVQVALE